MKIAEMRSLTDVELNARMQEAYQELFNLRFQQATRQLANYRRLRQVKRTIARFQTIQREREIQAEAGG